MRSNKTDDIHMDNLRLGGDGKPIEQRKLDKFEEIIKSGTLTGVPIKVVRVVDNSFVEYCTEPSIIGYIVVDGVARAKASKNLGREWIFCQIVGEIHISKILWDDLEKL